MSWDGTVRCGNCYEKGHNRNGCPQLKERMEARLAENPEDWRAKAYFEKKNRRTKRTCGYCRDTGHNRKTCPEAIQDRQRFIEQNQTAREKALEWMRNSGMGIGTLVEYSNYYDGKCLALVESVQWEKIDKQTVLIDENDVGIPDDSCLVVAKANGDSSRSIANPRNAEIVGTIPSRLVSAQVPCNWLYSTDKPTLAKIDDKLKENDMNYIRRYILKTEDSLY